MHCLLRVREVVLSHGRGHSRIDRRVQRQELGEGDTEAAEAMGMVDMSFGLEIWENEDERERWKVTDWTEEEEQAMAGATYEWIRMDADNEWIAKVQFEQPDYMWVSQLQRDRDVVAQVEVRTRILNIFYCWVLNDLFYCICRLFMPSPDNPRQSSQVHSQRRF